MIYPLRLRQFIRDATCENQGHPAVVVQLHLYCCEWFVLGRVFPMLHRVCHIDIGEGVELYEVLKLGWEAGEEGERGR